MTTEVGRREGKRTSQRCCSALNERTRNLFMCEAASRIVLTTTLPPSLHRPASLLRRTMNLVIFWIKMMVVILTMTEVKLIIIMIWIRMMILIMTAR